MFALLLAGIPCWVDRCFDSWALLAFFCLLRVTLIPPNMNLLLSFPFVRVQRTCVFEHAYLLSATRISATFALQSVFALCAGSRVFLLVCVAHPQVPMRPVVPVCTVCGLLVVINQSWQ